MAVVFPLPWLPKSSRVFPTLSHSDHKHFNKNKGLICSQQGLNPQPLNHKAIAQLIQLKHICDNPQYFRISLSHFTLKYINKIIVHI